MKLIVAPDSFKGSLSAVQVADAIAAGALRSCPEATVLRIPLADGGEGTVEALVRCLGGIYSAAVVEDPIGRPVRAVFGLLPDHTAVLEMASASGLPLLRPNERNPFQASTFGTGQLIRAALDAGVERLILGVGGSATVDGGAGALQALGVRLLDDTGNPIPRGNAGLAQLARIDTSELDPRLRTLSLLVATDVINPLLGSRGSAAVFGPQKGASTSDIPLLEAHLARFAAILLRDLGQDLAHVPGSGAAGGLTAGLLALGARTEPGIDLVLEATHFDDQIAGADLILTGEGKIDAQTIQGKVISGVLRRARAGRVPVVALAGTVRINELAELYTAGLTAAVPIVPGPVSSRFAFTHAASLLERTAETVLRLWAHPVPRREETSSC